MFIASAYLGGEGVISLLVAGLDHLYREAGIFDQQNTYWPDRDGSFGLAKDNQIKGQSSNVAGFS